MRRKQASPNRALTHVPLFGRRRDVATITVDSVMGALAPALGSSAR